MVTANNYRLEQSVCVLNILSELIHQKRAIKIVTLLNEVCFSTVPCLLINTFIMLIYRFCCQSHDMAC